MFYGSHAKAVNRRHRGAFYSVCMGPAVWCACVAPEPRARDNLFLDYTACYGRQKYPQKVSSFGNFLSGTFAKKTFVARSVWGEEKFVPGTGGIWRRVALTLIPEKVATS